MKRFVHLLNYFLLLLNLLFPELSQAQSSVYHTPDQVQEWIKQIEASHPGIVTSVKIASSPGERPLNVIRIGKELKPDMETVPSIFVGANLEGNRPLTTEGAIFLAETILSDPAHIDSLNWYIIPLGNPDAAARFFETPLYEDPRNDMPTNDDRDDQTDEDGVNDLNGDGWISRMRVIDPAGEWIISDKDPRLMRKADPQKGEQGVYSVYTEGNDEDGDGEFNEDGPGGTNVGVNFPQFFKHFTTSGGLFPGSAPEAYGIMKFVFEHPDIAMIVSLGSTNWCYTPPKGERKGEKDLNKISLSERQARQFNLNTNRIYTITELVEIFKVENPQSNIDEGILAGYLDLGAVLNPQEGDLVFYKKYAKAYKSYLKEKGVQEERIEPAPAPDGSLELWGYFQVGVPVFSMDLWGMNKIDTAKSDAETGQSELALDQAMLAFADNHPEHKGFVEWKAFDHPTLGSVEIGGFVPYFGTTPPGEWADSLLQIQIPWIFQLARELPSLHIYEVKTSEKGNGIYQLDIWTENRSFIPFPTNMGKRNMQPAPAILSVEGEQIEFVSGYRRTPITSIEGHSRIKTTLIIQKEKPGKITLKLDSKTAGHDELTINIGG